MDIFNLKIKKRFRFLVLLFVLAGMAATATFVYANYYIWTERTVSGFQSDWKDVAISSDGSTQYALRAFDGIYKSSDSGANWSLLSGPPASNWRSITTSSDGVVVIAAAYNHDIYYSIDGGSSWALASTPQKFWVSIASSASGMYVVAATDDNYIWTSTDYGANWTQRTNGLDQASWTSVASSASGQYLVTVHNGGYAFTSTDYGETWTARTASGARTFTDITSSSDGAKLAAATYDGYVYTSTDYGVTWVERDDIGAPTLTAITSSANGDRLAVATDGSQGDGVVFISLDGGATWSQETLVSKKWRGLAFSESGGKLLVASSDSYLFTAEDNILPYISEITSSLPHGTFGTGDVIDIDVLFSEPVTTSGADVTLTFNTGGSCAFQVSGSLSATCDYTVSAGESSADLQVVTVSMSSGDIRDSVGNVLTNFSPSVNLADSRDFVINTSTGGGGYAGYVRVNTVVTNATNTTQRSFPATSTVPEVPETPVVVPVPGAPDTKPLPETFPPLLEKYEFSRDYKFGDRGIEEIRTLQKFLNLIGFTVSETGPGSKGRETAIFGYFTRKALVEFQKAYGITPALGYYGPITRGVINSILSK